MAWTKSTGHFHIIFVCTSVIEFDQRMNFTTLITVVAVCSIWLDMAPTFARRRCWK